TTAVAEQGQSLGKQLAATGLAVGAGDADQAQGGGRLAVKTCCNLAQFARQVDDRYQRYRPQFKQLLPPFTCFDQNGNGSAGDRARDMVTTIMVGTLAGDEQVARGHTP